MSREQYLNTVYPTRRNRQTVICENRVAAGLERRREILVELPAEGPAPPAPTWPMEGPSNLANLPPLTGLNEPMPSSLTATNPISDAEITEILDQLHDKENTEQTSLNDEDITWESVFSMIFPSVPSPSPSEEERLLEEDN